MITVIAPIYNVEKYISLFLDSLDAQSYKHFELILVNDGSTDRTVEICINRLSRVDFDWKLVNQENSGYARARNVGVNKAKGEWIAFLDSDDMISLDYLENMYKAACSSGSDIVFGAIKRVDEDFSKICRSSGKYKMYSQRDSLWGFLKRRLELVVASSLVKKDFLVNSGIIFPEDCRYGADLFFLWQILPVVDGIAKLVKPNYFYRQRRDSVMGTPGILKNTEAFNQIKRIEQYYRDMNFEFSKTFEKFGVARWVFGDCNNAAKRMHYKDFLDLIRRNGYDKYFRRLVRFPDIRVKLLSLIFLMNPKLFFCLLKS